MEKSLGLAQFGGDFPVFVFLFDLAFPGCTFEIGANGAVIGPAKMLQLAQDLS